MIQEIIMSENEIPTAKEVLDALPLESLYPNAKKFSSQQLIDDYIKNAGRDPQAIKDMIEAKRAITKDVIIQARSFYTEENTKLDRYKKELKDEPSLPKDVQYNANIAKIQKNIREIQKCINATEQNVSTKISQPFDKKFEASKEIKALRQLLTKNDTLADPNQLPSEKEIKNKLTQTTKALKAWKDLSKARDDTDRSKGFARLSDNVASMATTSLNAPRKAFAFGQALLTYAVVDVLYTGLVKGTAKGLVKGADTGYSAANDAVKKTANNIYKIVDNSQRNLAKEVKRLESELEIPLIDKDKNLSKNEAVILAPYVQTVQSKQTDTYTPVTKDYLDAAKSPQEKASILIQFMEYNDIDADSVKTLKTLYDTAVIASKPSLPTRALAGASGIVPAIVMGIVNAAWEGVKKPTLAATVDMPEGVGNRLTNLKEGQKWARTHSEVKEHRTAKEMAEALGAYAKNANPKEFDKMVKDAKAQKQKQDKQFNKIKGMFRT